MNSDGERAVGRTFTLGETVTDPERWRVALHEAAHFCAAIAAGAREVTAAIGGITGGHCGARDLPRGGIPEAVWLAAGRAADSLARQFQAPELPTATADPVAWVPAETRDPGMSARAVSLAGIENDDRGLAFWAIAGRESDPDCWAFRVRWAHSLAGEFVRRHEGPIVAVARRLYETGKVDASDIDELGIDKRELRI